jgi:hypothetical protein
VSYYALSSICTIWWRFRERRKSEQRPRPSACRAVQSSETPSNSDDVLQNTKNCLMFNKCIFVPPLQTVLRLITMHKHGDKYNIAIPTALQLVLHLAVKTRVILFFDFFSLQKSCKIRHMSHRACQSHLPATSNFKLYQHTVYRPTVGQDTIRKPFWWQCPDFVNTIL